MSGQRELFERWSNQFDLEGDEWEDMGRDEIFFAGMQAAQAQGAEPVAGLKWAVQKCKAMQSQGFDRVRLDILQKDFENAIESFATSPQPAKPERRVICLT